MAILCPICNRLFQCSEEYSHHECKTENEEEITHENTNDVLMCETVSDPFQISDEMHALMMSLSEEKKQDMVIDLYEGDGIRDLEIPGFNENPLRDEIPNERGALLPVPNNFNNYSGIQHPNNQICPEYNLNEPCISSGIRHRRENNAQSDACFPTGSQTLNKHQLDDMDVEARLNTNQPSVSAECSQMGYIYNGMNALFNENAPVVTNAGENKLMIRKVSLPQQQRVNQINMNPDEYPERNRRNSDCLGRRNTVYEEPKEKDDDCLRAHAGQMDANILENDRGCDAPNEVPSPTSPNTCSTNAEDSITFKCPKCHQVFTEFEDYTAHRPGIDDQCILNYSSRSKTIE
ncbi:hypothetical protein TNIN_206831 [Trichonephila inaurata madagascariensis]|uniref:Uncharacterized protein n=1 Tax=Trichonephila inaurata madagascariensis TaxID=2747483 RepID=A0A8X6WN90_9ARAC|nr:hypothetical protein TNIN_206831 [Trichonephila inaurata madagascariensis]